MTKQKKSPGFSGPGIGVYGGQTVSQAVGDLRTHLTTADGRSSNVRNQWARVQQELSCFASLALTKAGCQVN